MKRAPTLNLNNSEQLDIEEQIKTSSKRSPTPTVAALSRRSVAVSPGNTITLPVLGRDITFICKKIDANFVNKATMVYSDNIRLQELLDSDALDDIMPTMTKSGQQFPGIGREISGVIEVADGSRRRKAAILAKKDYLVLVGDLTDKEMDYLSETGNDHRKPSAYEIGMRYKTRLEREFFNNVSQLSEDIKVDRKIIKRCIETASLPIEVIKCFKSPNELSARAGERLAKIYRSHKESVMIIAIELVKIKNELTTEQVISKFETVLPEQIKPKERFFRNGVKATYKTPTDVTFSLKNAPEDLIKQIEQLLERNLDT
ncbi:ParB/RepB/Spo0J family plasmid partition protein (plasmid) [Orbus sturtevantii]|uniref:ParB/RepB/Spo0J family plasmid partition protein n=1 Tax=Orbus sturtevantii TaxID=3074109 RepID=UPI00370D0755